MDWEKWRKARQTKNDNVGIQQIVGEDKHFWAEMYRKNNGKLEILLEGMLLDLRDARKPTAEQESWIREYQEGILRAVKSCHTEEELETEDKKMIEENKVLEAKQRVKNAKYM